MTAQEVNALPSNVRKYIHDLETLCDPAGLIRENALLRDQNQQLQILVDSLRDELNARD